MMKAIAMILFVVLAISAAALCFYAVYRKEKRRVKKDVVLAKTKLKALEDCIKNEPIHDKYKEEFPWLTRYLEQSKFLAYAETGKVRSARIEQSEIHEPLRELLNAPEELSNAVTETGEIVIALVRVLHPWKFWTRRVKMAVFLSSLKARFLARNALKHIFPGAGAFKTSHPLPIDMETVKESIVFVCQ